MRISAATDTETRSRLQELLKVYGEFQNVDRGRAGSLQSIVQAKEAELGILRDSEMLRQQVTDSWAGCTRTEQRDARRQLPADGASFGSGLLFAGLAIFKVLLEDTRHRASKPKRPADAG